MDYPLIKSRLASAASIACCAYSPVCEIYDREDKSFYDSPEWQKKRVKSHEYLLQISNENPLEVFPYYFVWNDYVCENLELFAGIKWHRHACEPHYDYSTEKCEKFLQKAYLHKIPIVYEEELSITQEFIKRVAGRTNIIIPHCGILNGGYNKLKALKIWDLPNVYADTSLVGRAKVLDFVQNFGADKLLYGSDFPWGSPLSSKQKFLQMHADDKLTKSQLEQIFSGNVLRLINAKAETKEVVKRKIMNFKV
eukprot:TRINITY_DN6831_c0_g1_i1.p1 TRINITY_DN6831_c0_g1~~TRINITY_DN6831_c0_g1_i1.p1  ORF type:complete len:292 (-),score=23.34 TRINITY_DN6831_c0_g1_i1:294-1049(-)